jgi:hypothetical protein
MFGHTQIIFWGSPLHTHYMPFSEVDFATLDAMEEGLTRRRAVPETTVTEHPLPGELWRCIWRKKDRCRKEKYGNPKIDRKAIFCLNSGELRFYLFWRRV